MASHKRTRETLGADIETLRGLSLNELKDRWPDFYDSACPTRISRNFLLRALAYRMQERVLGGLDRVTRRRLDRAAKDLAAGRSPKTSAQAKVKAGTRLLREWQGRVHEVIVLENSVHYRGESWPSLSAVAREITGTRWSGPRFFGLIRGAQDGRG